MIKKRFLKKHRNTATFAKPMMRLSPNALAHKMLSARTRAGLTQEAVADHMGATKSAVSRLENVGKHAPSMAPLKIC